MSSTTIFIDGSYFCFYRYYSIMNWWKISHKDEQLVSPIENPEFVEKFKKTFISCIHNITSKFGSTNIIVGRDCPRANIWRNALYPTYKANRPHDDTFLGGPFFKLAYSELFAAAGISKIISHPHLEADDCIALSVKHILETNPGSKIYVITSDRDYLQLACDQVEIYNLAFKRLDAHTNGAKCDLFCKIVMGDVSDNIKSVLKKCGPKTALKCYEDRAYFESRLKSENAYDTLELNTTLVDFNKIPENLIKEFLATF